MFVASDQPSGKCPGHCSRTKYVKRVDKWTDGKQHSFAPEDRQNFRIIVNHLVHNQNRKLVENCVELLTRRGFRYCLYNFSDYTNVLLHSNDSCCSRAKLVVEYVYFLRLFYRHSVQLSARKPEPGLLSVVLLLARETNYEQLLEQENRSPEEVAMICELLQIRPIDNPQVSDMGFACFQLGQLDYFRQAQRIRDRHGITRDVANCFQSMADLDNMVEQLRNQNPVEFLVQAYALGVIDSARMRLMYQTAKSYDQLVSIYERTAATRAEYADRCSNREHGKTFVAAFHRIRRNEATWQQAMLLFLTGINVPDSWHLPAVELESLPLDVVDLYLNYLVVYSYVTLSRTGSIVSDISVLNNFRRLPRLVEKLLERGETINFAVESHNAAKQTVVGICPSIFNEGAHFEKPCPRLSTAGTLIRLGQLRSSISFDNWRARLCCPVKQIDFRFVYDNSRLASLQCLAARAFKLDRDVGQLPGGLRRTILVHQDYNAVIMNADSQLSPAVLELQRRLRP